MGAFMNAVSGMSPQGNGLFSVMIDIAIKSLVILSAAGLLVLAMRRASAATRHLVWCVAVCGLLLLPAVTLVAPKWTVPGLQLPSIGDQPSARVLAQVSAGGAGEAGEAGGAQAEPARLGVAHRAPRVAVQGESIEDAAPREVGIGTQSYGISTGAATPTAVTAAATAIPLEEPRANPFGGIDWITLLPIVWLAGAGLLLAWMIGGLVRAWLLVRSAREVTHGPVAWLFEELSDELGLAGRVTLLRAGVGTMPMVWGIRPRVIIPAEADDWTDDRLRAVLLHELAHVKRFDYLTQLVARSAGTLYWFNPLVWVAVHRMRVERELACDDRVLNTGPKASDYAGHLLEIARAASGRSFASYGGVAMARRSRLSDRLLAVLDDTRRRATVTPRVAATAFAGAACILLPVAGAGFDAATEPEGRTADESGVPAPVSAVARAWTAPSPTAGNAQAAVGSTVHAATLTSAPIVSSPSRLTRLSAVFSAERVATVRTAGGTSAAQWRCDWYDRDANVSHWMSGEDDNFQVRISMDDCRLEIEVGGQIIFDEAETGIVEISRRGYFEMEEREGSSRRRIVIEPTGGGDLERRWYVNGDEQPYGAEASEWLREMIPLLFRRVGLQAEDRAARILEQRGVDGVLQEISEIPSDYIARKYYQVLLTDADLDATQLRSIVRQAGAELESDYELAQLLVEVAENHPVNESVLVVYVEAAGSLESDYEQRRVLDTILSRQDLSPEVAAAMLDLATDLESDYELAELLIAILHRHPIDEALTTEFFEAVHTLESDYEHNRVLKVALHEGAPSLEVLDLALESAARIDSDYERAELLLEVARLYPVDRDMPSSYLVAAQSLSSDYELGRVLKFLVDNQRLSEDALEIVLDAALTLDSDYELANLLLEVVSRYELNERERDTYFRAVTSMESDYELGRVLKAIIEQGPLTEQNLRSVLTAAEQLDSEYELANLLISVADNHDLEGDLREMFLRTLDAISSDYERGRVLSALNPRRRRQ